MIIQRKLSAGLVALALLTNASTPAFSRDHGYRYGRGHHGWRHHHDRLDGGDIVAGVALIAILAAVLSASGKNKHDTKAVDSQIDSEDEAVDACAEAAEKRLGNDARVQDISDVKRTSDGWLVAGTVKQRDDWDSDATAGNDQFTCTVRFGIVQDVTLENGSVALN